MGASKDDNDANDDDENDQDRGKEIYSSAQMTWDCQKMVKAQKSNRNQRFTVASLGITIFLACGNTNQYSHFMQQLSRSQGLKIQEV